MKRVFFAIFALTSATVATPLLAQEQAAPEERVIHYQVDAPKSTEAALALLTGKTQEIGVIMAKATLDDNSMESIHEKTYSLEAAINKIREDNKVAGNEAAIDEADEAIQSLHYASENHKQDESRKWYIRLEPAVEKIKTNLQI